MQIKYDGDPLLICYSTRPPVIVFLRGLFIGLRNRPSFQLLHPASSLSQSLPFSFSGPAHTPPSLASNPSIAGRTATSSSSPSSSYQEIPHLSPSHPSKLIAHLSSLISHQEIPRHFCIPPHTPPHVALSHAAGVPISLKGKVNLPKLATLINCFT